LLLRCGQNEGLARQRLEVGDEGVVLHYVIEIDVYRHWQCGGTGRDIQHLPRPDVSIILWLRDQGHPGASLEGDQFTLRPATRFED
jgi:hypothetical protein